MDLLADLNPEQREAVEQIGGPLLILAGAGSGKTRVIAHRIAHLIDQGHARPDQVLAVTFTNKAADEMRQRVETLLGMDCHGLWISTFHALCARLLRREGPAIGLSRDFVIYDSTDQLAAVKQALRSLQIDESYLQPRAALSRISQAKNTMEGPESFTASWNPRGEQLAKVYASYVRSLAEASALDFDDLLLKTVDLFDAEAVRSRYSSKFRFVMVDEYQDTNRPQYLLIRRLAEAHRNLCVVGDPDQSIYKWRGADLRNILDFEHDFAEARIVRLERNYRSTQIILDAATAVISQNRNRKDKQLWTERRGGAKILYFRGGDELEEADFIAQAAQRAVDADVENTIAVLYRTNAQSRAIEDALMRRGLGYRVIGGVRFYERREIKDALAYLKLLLNPHDDVSFRRVVNTPARGVGKAVLDGLERIAVDSPGDLAPLLAAEPLAQTAPPSLWTRLTRAVDERLLAPRALASLQVFRDLVTALAAVARREAVATTIGKVLDQSGYLQDLRDERSEDAEGRLENLAELVSAAREYEAREPEAALSGFVDRLSLLSDVDEETGARDARISLLTLHSAKGLEFPVVILAGLEEGLFPHSRSSEEEAELEEERRLCYVGMTRAKAQLLITGAARRRVFGEYQSSEPSRFISEIPPALIESVPSAARAYSQSALPRYELRANPYGRPRRGGRGTEGRGFAYEDEDQSGHLLRAGARVRHPQFGAGTVVSVEALDDDAKVVVRFEAVGRKTLRAKYAKLEPA